MIQNKQLTENYLQAKNFISIQDYEKAYSSLNTCIKLDSNFDPAYFELSKLYIQQGRELQAKELLVEATKKNPQNINFYLLLAEIYFHNLNTHLYDLINLYQRLFQMGYKDTIALFRLSFLYSKALNMERSNHFLALAYENNKINTPQFNLLLQYEIIDAILFNFNYQKIDNFHEQYYKKILALPELGFNLTHKYTAWNTEKKSKIRLGFVSGDLMKHSVSFFLKPLISHIDTDKYELYAFSTTQVQDEQTLELKKHFAHWEYIDMRQSQAGAQKIHQQNIDILFDLSGHTAKNGLLLFKYKPAPIQISWLGYFSSTGLPEMDYFITSPYCVLENEKKYFTEKVLYLPQTYLSYDFSQHNAAQTSMPYDSNQYITFGFFQNLSKVNEKDFQLWNKILQEIPTARLIIKSSELSNPEIKQNLMKKIQHLPRVQLRGHTDLAEHLRQHNDVDVMLDAYSVSGGTTTCQSLYMGVPIFSFKGFSMLTRHGEQFLSILNLYDFIANDMDDFVEKAKNINIAKLRNIKKNLRQNVLNSSIGNAKIFTKQFEQLLESLKK